MHDIYNPSYMCTVYTNDNNMHKDQQTQAKLKQIPTDTVHAHFIIDMGMLINSITMYLVNVFQHS